MKLNSYLWLAGILFFVFGVWLQPLAAQNSSQTKWTPTGSLVATRVGHTATLLPNGRVLIVGGYSGSQELASVELYDPSEGVFVPAADLATGRTNHTATLLNNGQVLVVGGQFRGNTLASTELYNPATGMWTATSKLHLARSYHTATLLPNGQVLVVGGTRQGYPPLFPQGAPPGSALDIAELYDPASGKWTVTDNLHKARYLHTATLLLNGQVLVAGGISSREAGAPSNEFELEMPERSGNAPLSARLMRQNRGGDIEASAELYNPFTKTWTITGSLPTPLLNHTASLLPNGQVLVAGGKPTLQSDTASAELYNLSTGTWTPTGSLHAPLNAHSATLLSNGQVLVAGGANETGVLANADLYNPSTGTWETTVVLSTARSLQTATLLPNNRVLVTGGCYALGLPTDILASAELYSPVAETAQVSTPKPALAEAVHACPVPSEPATKPLLTLATCLVIFTVCLVILTACVVILLCAWLVFVLIQRWRK